MNNNIKELAELAGLEMCRCGCNMPTRQTAKFAELIIRECINQVELTWMNQNGWSRNASCVQSIKQKFGFQ